MDGAGYTVESQLLEVVDKILAHRVAGDQCALCFGVQTLHRKDRALVKRREDIERILRLGSGDCLVDLVAIDIQLLLGVALRLHLPLYVADIHSAKELCQLIHKEYGIALGAAVLGQLGAGALLDIYVDAEYSLE